jgi:hypothetical protein
MAQQLSIIVAPQAKITRGRKEESEQVEGNGSKGRHFAVPYMDFDPILIALDSYRVTGVPARSDK